MGRRKLTQEQVLDGFREKHGDKYDYSKVEYVNARRKVHIICKRCNSEFEQAPAEHKRGTGCPTCGGCVKHTQESIIIQFREKHGDKYDYSKVVYVGSHSKVIIGCKRCGNEFEQAPTQHKRGQGCPTYCYTTKDTQESIVEKFKGTHGNKYDYSKVRYVDCNTKVIIGCRKCGVDFEMIPVSHTRGINCPNCNSFKSEKLFGKVLRDLGFHPTKARPKWLKNPHTNALLEIDHYLQRHKIGFEVQGRQHYEPVDYWGGVEKLKEIQERDRLKRTLCEKRGVRLIEYDLRNGKDYESMQKFILEHLKEEYDHTKTIWAKVETKGMDIFDFFDLF